MRVRELPPTGAAGRASTDPPAVGAGGEHRPQRGDATGHSRPHVGSAAGPGTQRSAAEEPGRATGGQSPWRDRGGARPDATQEPT